MRLFRRRSNKVPADPGRQTDIIACLDLEETQVRAALIERQGDALKIVGLAKVPVSADLRLSGLDINRSALQNHCFQALKMAKGGLDINLRDFVLGVSGDFIKGVTHKIQLRRAYPHTPFSQRELDQLIARNQAEALKMAEAEIQAENPGQNPKLQLLNSSLIGFVLDGRPHPQPLGRQANFAGIQLYNVFVPDFWQDIGRQMAEELNLELVALAYKPFALMRGFLGNVFKPDLEALLIQIEDQATYVIVVKNGTLIRTKHFGLGDHIFNQALSRNLDLNYAAAANLRDASGEFDFSRLTPAQQEKAKKVFNHTTAVWLQGLTLTLKDFKLAVLPAKIYLTGQAANLKALAKSLQQPTLLKVLPFKDKLQIEVLGLSRMSQIESQVLVDNEVGVTTLAGLGRLASDVLNITRQAPVGGPPAA